MNKIFALAVLIAVIIFSAGCVAENNSHTNSDGDVYTGDEASGSIKYADGSVEVWHTDSQGNIRHEFTDTDGTIIKYYINKDGEYIYET